MYWDRDDAAKKPYLVSSAKSAIFEIFDTFSASADTTQINAMFNMYVSKCPSSAVKITGVSQIVPPMSSPLDVSPAAADFYLAAKSPAAAETALSAKTAVLPARDATSEIRAPTYQDMSDAFTGYVMRLRK